jgi:tetratricopeptide (TPR) repeat protein
MNASDSSFVVVCLCVLSLCSLCAPATVSAAWPEHQQAPPQQATTQQTSTQPPDKASVLPPSPPRTPFEEAMLRADLMMVRKEYSDAAVAYEKLLAEQPRNAALLNKLGLVCQFLTRLDLAKKYYEKAAKADRNFATPYNNLGTLYYQQKKYGKAVDNYLRALKLDSEMSVGYSNLGYAYFHMKKYDEAMDAFRRALAIDPEVLSHSSHSGGTLLQDRTVMADSGMFYFFLAKSFALRGDAPQCAQYLKRAIDDGYPNVLAARTDAAFKPVLKDPTIRELLQLEPLPPEPKTNIAPFAAR